MVIRLFIVVLVLGYPMFGFGKDKKTINVQFIESGKSEPFAVSDMPLKQLPDTFEIDTTMHLGDDDWRVIAAEPAEKEKFRKKGSLKLTLQKVIVEMVDPKEILYSIPTISNDIAGVEDAKSLENVAVFMEDDWRQFEILSIKYERKIEEDLKAVDGIYENHKSGMGFKEIHLRKLITKPLKNVDLKLEAIIKHFGMKHQYSGVAFNNVAATLVNGFALSTESGWLLWGQINDEGNIEFLNVAQTEESNIDLFSSKIDAFLTINGLYAVNWPRVFWAGPNKHSFEQYVE